MNNIVLAWCVLVFSGALIVMLLMTVFKRLKEAGEGWSIADALSEEVQIGTTDKDSNNQPIKNAEGNIALTSMMKASSSRLIALLGLVVILALYVGAGLTVIYQFALSGKVPDGTTAISQFFVYGLVMFTPYAVNKIAGVFDAFK